MILLKSRYFKKNITKLYYKKKSKTAKTLKIGNKLSYLKTINKKSNQIYYPIYSKEYLDTYLNFNFELYQNNFS